ncbi:hypothetical protein [Pseudomonas inefficax]|uniref:hypothetical protein n=1 Tax=Pseudomonas inefficax TaxID=2078786 RepID=UPI003263CA71
MLDRLRSMEVFIAAATAGSFAAAAVQLGMSAQFGSHSLIRFVAGFIQRYPNIEIDLNLSDRSVNI